MISPLRSFVLPTLVLLLSLPAHAARGRIPDVVEDALAFALTDRDKAIQLLEDTLAHGPKRREINAIAVAAGEQRRLAGEADHAERWFRSVLERGGRGHELDAARLGLALLQIDDETSAESLGILRDVDENSVLATLNADRFLALTIAAARADQVDAVREYARKALEHASEDPEVLRRVRDRLEALGAPVADVELPTPPPADSRARGPLDKAESALANGRRDEARKIAEKALADARSGSFEHRALSYLLRRIDAAEPSSQLIAVLLPLSGRYGGAGEQVKQALELGYRQGGGNRTLRFIDSGATPEEGVAALEQAVLELGAVAVVGPLLSDQTDAMVEAAEALRVPLVSLSRSLDDTDQLEWTIQAMTSTRDEVTALLDEVMGKQGMKAFAVFAPENTYGKRSTEVFRQEVAERGGKVTVVEYYDPSSPDLLPAAKRLGRKDYDARASEFRQLRREASDRGRDPGKVVLPPLLDFDALFIPDAASRVPLACAALAYEEFPMGDFQPHRDSPVIPLLGLSGWNDERIVGTGGPYARRGYFTDAFVLPPGESAPWTAPTEIVRFVETYRSDVGRTPTSLEAIVSDAGRLLAHASRSRARTRPEFLQALLEADPDGTATRVSGVDAETRRVHRDLWILSVSETAILPHEALPPRETW